MTPSGSGVSLTVHKEVALSHTFTPRGFIQNPIKDTLDTNLRQIHPFLCLS